MSESKGGIIAALTRTASDFAKFTEKLVPVATDIILIEDSADSGNKKKAQVGNLPFPAITSSAPADVTKAAAAVGVGTTCARSDHKHDVTTASASANPPGTANAEGSATSLARSDHTHALAAFGSGAGNFCQGNDSRLADDRTASGLRSATTVVSVSAATAPSIGQVLTATGTTTATWQTPTTGSAPAGSAGDIQYNAGGGAFGATNLHYWDTGNGDLVMGAPTRLTAIALPAAPNAGDVRLFVNSALYCKASLAVMGADGVDYPLQPEVGELGVSLLVPAATTSISGFGSSWTVAGTLSTPTLASTNLQTQMRRFRLASSTTAGTSTSIREAAASCWRGNAAGLGGFLLVVRFSLSTAIALQRFFVGLYATTTAIGNVEPSTLLNMVGVGRDSTDANLQIMCNDGSGAASKADLGASFPRSATDVYILRLYAAPNASSIDYVVTNLSAGGHLSASGNLAANLPITTALMLAHIWTNNTSTAAAAQIDVASLYQERPY